MRCEPAIERVGRAQPGAGQPEIATEMPGAQVQKPGRADIRKQPDPGFRHGQHGALGSDPIGAVDRDPGAAAHGDAVDDREVGFREAVDLPDDLVFFAKEHRGEFAVAGDAAAGLVDRPDVAAGAEGALAGAADQDGMEFGALLPLPQHRRQRAVHTEGEGVERLRPVQGDGRQPAFPPEQDVVRISHRPFRLRPVS